MIDSFSPELELNMLQETSFQLKSESIKRRWQCKFNTTFAYLSKLSFVINKNSK